MLLLIFNPSWDNSGPTPPPPPLPAQFISDVYQASTSVSGKTGPGTMTGQARTQSISGKPGTQ